MNTDHLSKLGIPELISLIIGTIVAIGLITSTASRLDQLELVLVITLVSIFLTMYWMVALAVIIIKIKRKSNEA